jgi:transposase-like protein
LPRGVFVNEAGSYRDAFHRLALVFHSSGKQRYQCRACPERGRTFLLEYTYAGQSAEVKQQLVDMAMHASGMRDTARVLHVSPTTVMKELKKRNLRSSKCIRQ